MGKFPNSPLSVVLLLSATSNYAQALSSSLISSSRSSTKISSTDTGKVGDYILAGLAAPSESTDVTVSSFTPSPTSNATQTRGSSSAINKSSTITSAPASSTILSSISSNKQNLPDSGLDFAWSCNTALWDWATSYLTTSTSTVTTISTWTNTHLIGVSASHVTTLCDGHPRAIGNATPNTTVTSFTQMYTSVSMFVPESSQTSMPCSIGPSDCAQLSSIVHRSLISLGISDTTVTLPACATAGTSVPFSLTSCANDGGNGLIYASTAQLLYWPVRTKTPEAPWWCEPVQPDAADTIETIPGTRTGEGPNTFVTGTLTITSPTVGIVLRTISRQGGCGPTIDSTIVTLPPQAVSSQRGARALFQHHQFNFADLNWVCPSDQSSNYTTQFMSSGPDCYQDVQALAYFSYVSRWDSFTALATSYINGTSASIATAAVQSLVIMNDFFPKVVPDTSLLASWATSIWGSGVLWMPNGVQDPPIALGQASIAAVATLPVIAQTTDSAQAIQTTTTAAPGQQSSTLLPTELPAVSTNVIASISSSSSSSTAIASSPSGQQIVSSASSTDLPLTSVITSAQPAASPSFSFDPTSSGSVTDSISSTEILASQGHVQGTASEVSEAKSVALTIGTSTATIQILGSSVVIGSETLGSSAATTIDGQQISNGASGLVLGTGSAAKTINAGATISPTQVTVGSQTLAVSQTSNIVVIGSQSLTVGGSQQIVGDQTLSADFLGVIVAGTSSTITLAAQPPSQVVTVEPTTLLFSKVSSNIVAADGQSLTIGGDAQTLGGQVVSAGLSGIVVGAEFTTTAIPYTTLSTPQSAEGVTVDVVVIGSSTLTRIVSQNGDEILSDTATTLTLTAGHSATTLGSFALSAGNDGLHMVSSGVRTTLSLLSDGPAVVLGTQTSIWAADSSFVSSNSTSQPRLSSDMITKTNSASSSNKTTQLQTSLTVSETSTSGSRGSAGTTKPSLTPTNSAEVSVKRCWHATCALLLFAIVWVV